MQDIDPSAWIAPSAELYGRITIGEGSSLWPQAVIRAECQEVRIGSHTNLQDFVMIHVGYDHPTRIGDFCSITHHATVHGAVIEDDCLIGINAVVMDGAVIGRGSIVAPGAVVTEGTIIPPHSIVGGVPAKVPRRATKPRGPLVMTRFRGEKRWHPLESLVPTWEEKPPTMKELRGWVAPLVAGNQHLAPLIAHNLRPRFHPVAKLRRWSRRLKPTPKKHAASTR